MLELLKIIRQANGYACSARWWVRRKRHTCTAARTPQMYPSASGWCALHHADLARTILARAFPHLAVRL
jgi:hypothetical protein